LRFPLENENHIPTAQIAAKTQKEMDMHLRNRVWETEATCDEPKYREKKRVTMVMLTIWPTILMVAEMPDASPYWDLVTELIMVFMLGEENRAKPKPIKTRSKIITYNGVDWFVNVKNTNPAVQIDIPVVAKYLGCTLSDNLPKTGENIAINRGWANKMKPAFCGESPFICCK